MPASTEPPTPPPYHDVVTEAGTLGDANPTLVGELARAQYEHVLQAWLDELRGAAESEAAEATLAAQREDTDRATEAALFKQVHDAYLATSQSSLDRALTRVNVVTGAIAAISTLYTGLLGLVYTNDRSKGGSTFTAASMLPALFLGLALFLVTIYAAMFRRSLANGPLLPSGLGADVASERVVTFMRWAFAGVYARARALHAGIVSFGVAIVTLPTPFIVLSTWQRWVIFVVGLLLVALGALPELVLAPSSVRGIVGEWWRSWRPETDAADGSTPGPAAFADTEDVPPPPPPLAPPSE